MQLVNKTLNRNRLLGIYSPNTKCKLRSINILTFIITVSTVSQVTLMYVLTCMIGDQSNCNTGVSLHVWGYYVYISVYGFIGLMQFLVLVLTILPLISHQILLKKRFERRSSWRKGRNYYNVIFRLIVSSVVFVASDITLSILLMTMKRVNTWFPIFTTINLNINTFCIKCSYSNYMNRLLPFSLCSTCVENNQQLRRRVILRQLPRQSQIV